jgi:hypothetical protein
LRNYRLVIASASEQRRKAGHDKPDMGAVSQRRYQVNTSLF